MKALRMHAGCLLVNVLARYAVGVMGQRIVEIAFGKKTKKTKKKKRCRNEFLYGGSPAQRGFKIDLRKDIISHPTLPEQVEGDRRLLPLGRLFNAVPNAEECDATGAQ
ncbi:hypothetical protein [Flavisolibacter ginsenosidimutans]|uniref:Uncharacterized protein n=1 Tax=Flavisolibacter ginsenosidimutans TaxID=661481 RepID=A0A5B8UN65_9BACT|nr:hypothetical protein [Flavisolibacter ginsenosidimutans]QEC58111.1 hypothetical protein FSB75_20100 [Flavisolibacter ginsenosidimutans]